MKAERQKTDLSEALTAERVLAEFCSDPENERLFCESEISLDLSELMRAMRKGANLRQEDLASRVGCSQSFIAKLERGGYNRVGIGGLRTYVRAMAHDIDVSRMFFPIDQAVFSGQSSGREQPTGGVPHARRR